MKQLIITLTISLLSLSAVAQNLSAVDQLKANPRKAYGNDYPNPRKAYGNDYPYQQEACPLTKSPKGYKPFYISHYARHGSRYYWNDKLYKELDTLLTAAHSRQQLTAEGEAFYLKFEAAKQELMTGVSELTQLGWEQHQGIARTMYNRFPEVFKKGGNVLAVSSLSGRCVLSMSAFCQELVQCNPKIEIREQSSRFTLDAVVPDDRQNPNKRQFPKAKPRYEQHREQFKGYEDRKAKVGQLLSRIFTSRNLGSYSWVFGSKYIVIPILEDFIKKADAVLDGSSDHIADLRFGHDSYIGPLTVLFGINGADRDPEDPNEVKNCYQNWETCKACNIQLVFYRSKKASDPILVKCLLNGCEATLPVPTSQYPYYQWTDFRDFYTKRCKDVPAN